MLSAEIFRVTDIPIGAGMRDGPSAFARFDAEFATGPAWPSCAAASAPSAWITSVSRRKPGCASGRIQI
ncbi:Uncharacterised protein [Mycobacteroides abscessus subsp. abscessus]|nr:Uncharacterised protein [Mycobacteroides abscessus subsp. abscessus]